MQKLLTAAAVIVAALSAAASLTRSTPARGVVGCSQLVHNRIVQVARDNGLTIVKESLWACRRNGDEAVARVRIWYDVTDPWFGKVRDTRTLVFRFERSPWQQTGFSVQP